MAIFLLVLLTLFWVGITLVRKITSIRRIELLIPVGIVLGLSFFTLVLNLSSFVFRGEGVAVFSYIFTLGFAAFLKRFKRLSNEPIEWLHKAPLVFFILGLVFWGGLIFWKAAYALIGSDTNLYYSIAHSFIKGNFPPITPWQPDVALSYHLGASGLLGVFYLFTGLNFQFLHLIFSTLFILCSVQVFIWIWGRHKDLLSFLLANLAGLVVFVSFGFFYLVLPNFPIIFPNINNLNELVIFLRNLPTVNQSIEVYGAPVNLDGLIYFIFHAFGLALFLALIVVLLNPKTKVYKATWVAIFMGLVTLASINEAVFIVAAPSLILGILYFEKYAGSLKKNLIILCFLILLSTFFVVVQGGVISSAVLEKGNNLQDSVLLFPKREDIKEDFISYHHDQQKSKLLPAKKEWLPFRWFSIGVDFLLIAGTFIIFIPKFQFKKRLLLQIFFISGLFSLLAYNFIVPRFLAANGNRFLALAFIFLSIPCLFYLLNKLSKIVIVFFILFILLPTILPPFALLSKTRFGENKLVPRKEQTSAGIGWIREKVPYNQRVMVLDARAPHPSGVARVLTQAGVFSPIFPGDFRAYTIEASPEYLDIAYFLSPFALKKLGVELLLIDSHFFQTLPILRKKQLNDDRYFEILFSHQQTEKEWEKIFKIKSEYIINGEEFDGNILKIPQLITSDSKIYIENEENFNPSFIRRAIIFILRDKDLYYLPQSGVYLNVEANINQKNPDENIKYDYLVLGENTNPKDKCRCKAKIVWKGLSSQVVLWRSEYFGKVEK